MKETYTTNDLNLLRLSALQNNHFQLYRTLVEKNYSEIYKILTEPLFSLKGLNEIIPDVSYRNINYWEEKDLLKIPRDDNKKWRKFSIRDTILIQIIRDLKLYGLDNDFIKSTMPTIADNRIFSTKDAKGGNIEELEYGLLETYAVITGNANVKTYLYIRPEKVGIFLTESEIVDQILKQDLHNHKPVLLLPFYQYVQTASRKSDEETMYDLNSTARTHKSISEENGEVQTIVNLRDPNIKEINIKKSKEKLTIQPKQFSKRTTSKEIEKLLSNMPKGSYKNIQISVQDGKITAVSEEDSIQY